MNRITILAGGAVLAAIVLCGGAVTMANAFSRTPGSQVLTVAGVSTPPTATPSATPTATPTPSDVPTVTPSAPPTSKPGGDKGVGSGVTVVTPSDPTKIDGKGCAHLAKDGVVDPAKQYPTGTAPNGYDPHKMVGTPVPQYKAPYAPHPGYPAPGYPTAPK